MHSYLDQAIEYAVLSILATLLAMTVMTASASASEAEDFIRGDLNNDGLVELSDAQELVNYLFLGAEGPSCEDTSDVNDDGLVNIADISYILGFLFWGGSPPPEPFAEAGEDPTHDDPFECGDSCVPLTCQEAGVECGITSDGCGGELNCGNSCFSDVCESGECQDRTCHDGVRNGNETDIDCGGSDCRGWNCSVGDHCVSDRDCSSDNCRSGTCRAQSNGCTSGPCRWVPGSRGMRRVCTPLPRLGQCWGNYDCDWNSTCRNAYVGTTSCRVGYCSS